MLNTKTWYTDIDYAPTKKLTGKVEKYANNELIFGNFYFSEKFLVFFISFYKNKQLWMVLFPKRQWISLKQIS